jgi:hypothetical protein
MSLAPLFEVLKSIVETGSLECKENCLYISQNLMHEDKRLVSKCMSFCLAELPFQNEKK